MTKFVSFEGMEGVGKSSLIEYLLETLNKKKINVVATREPGGTKVADNLRRIVLESDNEKILPETELLILLAARKQHIEHFIRPHLNDGYIVLSDRFVDASYAYQCGGRGLSPAILDKLNNLMGLNLMPNLTFLLDAPIATCLKRLGNRKKSDRFDREGSDFFEKVRESYLQRAKAEPERFVLIDCDMDFELVCQTVLKKFIDRIA